MQQVQVIVARDPQRDLVLLSVGKRKPVELSESEARGLAARLMVASSHEAEECMQAVSNGVNIVKSVEATAAGVTTTLKRLGLLA